MSKISREDFSKWFEITLVPWWQWWQRWLRWLRWLRFSCDDVWYRLRITWMCLRYGEYAIKEL